VSTAGWIFLVGMRVFDLGGMIVWLVWFSRQRDEPEDWEDWRDWDDPVDEPDPPSPPKGGSGLPLPLPESDPWRGRIRDHTMPKPVRVERRGVPVRREQPAERPGR
jgi:hypothetical protein